MDVAGLFASEDDRVWLNTAHQGRLPLPSMKRLHEAAQWKLHPTLLQDGDYFVSVPAGLRTALAAVLDARPEDVALANSASYGLHLIANGLELGAGDEVVVAANDFPSDVLPWLRLRDRGVEVRALEPAGEVASADEVATALTPRTRVVCLTWVHSFSGRVLDVDAVGSVCRDNGTLFVLNGSQGVGSRPLSVKDARFDALVGVGFKWLCGPYGTGYCWLHPDLQERLVPQKLYWLSALSADDLAGESLDLDTIAPEGIRRFDVFGTANFFNFAPFTTSLELVTELGIDAIFDHDQALVQRLIDGIDEERFRLVSSPERATRSSLVVLEPRSEPLGPVASRLAGAGIYVAQRRGRIRISPHLYNTIEDIDAALTHL